MIFVGDFYVNSGYAGATSSAPNPEKWPKIKGIKFLEPADFTYPLWFKELKGDLEPADPGFFKLRNKSSKVRLINL